MHKQNCVFAVIYLIFVIENMHFFIKCTLTKKKRNSPSMDGYKFILDTLQILNFVFYHDYAMETQLKCKKHVDISSGTAYYII